MYLFEELQKGGKSLHMTHSDETIFIGGTKMAKATQDIFYDLAKKLSSEKKLDGVTVKYDGAPAVFAGYDPQDGKFFVGTKGVFNKNPKVAKSQKDITEFYQGDLAVKMSMAFEVLQKVIPKGYSKVVQGDLMYSKGDVQKEEINGEHYVTVHPNTIKYAAQYNSDLAKQWLNTKLGIVWHTVYEGSDSLQNYKASFNFNLSDLNKTSDIWMDDADIKSFDKHMDKSKALSIMKKTRELNKYLSSNVDSFFKFQDSIPNKAAGAKFATFWNSNIRKGKTPKKVFLEYERYFKKYYEEKVVGKLKSEKGINSAKEDMKYLLHQLKMNRKGLEDAWAWSQEIGKLKQSMMEVLDSMSDAKTFLKMKDGSYKVTKPEGYVAFGKDGGAVKLVDRFEFSFANFSDTVFKPWMKGRS